MVLTYGWDVDGNRLLLLCLTSDDTERLIDGETLNIAARQDDAVCLLYRDNAEEATQALIDMAARQKMRVGDVREIHP